MVTQCNGKRYLHSKSDSKRSICADTAVVPRPPQRKVSSATGRGQGATGRGKYSSGRVQCGADRGDNFSRGQCGVDRGDGSGRGQCGADRGSGSGRGQYGVDRGGGSGRGQCGADRRGGSGRGQCGVERRGGSGRGQGGIGRGLARKIVNPRGNPFESGINTSSSQVPPLPTNKRPYNATSFAAATVYKRPALPGTSTERVIYGGINLKSTSPTNIVIGFKPSGLKWNGKDAVTNTQLQ
ncbi:putative nuclear transcription factor Y subunit A-1-like isoform X1 [Capsicum annuum]|nr:putative nuclear transcription factor Y subunit A-1-like isoform X1 [Capsicum annuum]